MQEKYISVFALQKNALKVMYVLRKMYPICINSKFISVFWMLQEMNNMREQIQKEVQLRKELDDKLAKMNQLLSTGQEALQQEKKTVEMLRQQLIQPNQKVTWVFGGKFDVINVLSNTENCS